MGGAGRARSSLAGSPGVRSRVLTKLVAQALEGTSTLKFFSDGLRWELDIPGSNALNAPVNRDETSR